MVRCSAFLSSLVLSASVGLSGCAGSKGEDDSYPELREFDLPTELQSGEDLVVMRLTDGSTTDSHVYEALNRLVNERLDLASLLMRGGVRTDPDGTRLPVAPLASGTAAEQLASFIANGGPADDALDTCGNPALASFVTLDTVAAAGQADPAAQSYWPAACGSDPACDTLEHGTIEVVLTEVRFDGTLDAVVNVFPDRMTGKPALWGHLLATWLTRNNPGFAQAPVALASKQFQLGLFGVLERRLRYVHPGVGTRDVLVVPHAARTVDAGDLQVAHTPLPGKECKRQWTSAFGGQVYGCDDSSPLLLDRSAPLGETLWGGFAKEGTDPSLLKALEQALAWQIQSAIVCPPVSGPDGPKTAWMAEGPVELFVCPAALGDLQDCLAAQDMEEYACRPVGGTVLVPVSQGEPLPLSEQQEPWLLRPDLLQPFAGTSVDLEIPVDGDTVLYLPELPRLASVRGPQGPASLPAPVADSHCDEQAAFRYDLGSAGPPGLYTLTVPWSDGSDEMRIHVTSVPTWRFE